MVKREKRTWTIDEEFALVDILYEVNTTSWKVDTRFKIGYLSFVEKEMKKRLPTCDLKADPYIKSKIKLMKRSLSYILDIQRNGSSFGWDDEQKMVTRDKEVYFEWAKVVSFSTSYIFVMIFACCASINSCSFSYKSREGSAPLFMKPFPHYDKLIEIYAKELANGDRTRGPKDVTDIEEDEEESNPMEVDTQVVGEATSRNRGNNNTPTTSKQSKRKSSELDAIELEFVQISKSISSLIDAEKKSALASVDIKKAFTHKVDVHELTCDKRTHLFPKLCTLPGLSPEEVVKATRLIGQDTSVMDLFYTMPDEFKVIFARQEIDGSI
ncbi:unnamed protein product [Amaranthus hypochondriacus]